MFTPFGHFPTPSFRSLPDLNARRSKSHGTATHLSSTAAFRPRG